MLSEILNIDRRLRIEYKKLLSSPFVNSELVDIIDGYLSAFAIFNKLTVEYVVSRYNSFIER